LGINENEYRPLIIDQPEENLDSRSIYTLLKGYFRKAKLRRQIIMVTHNPNLVVNTDSEQVIVANFDRESKNQASKICYVSGSLENTIKYDESIKNILESQGIREHTCEILEGGVKAFEERERRYSIK
jgi:predicted ATP-dependent endonuclease of OLD family